MSWSNRTRSTKRKTYWPCSANGCEREIGNFPVNECEECHRVFCAEHLFRVSVEKATLKLCRKCALERAPAVMERE